MHVIYILTNFHYFSQFVLYQKPTELGQQVKFEYKMKINNSLVQ